VDEIANVPAGLWKDIENLITNASGDGGLTIAGAFNPADPNDEVAKRAEPPQGWNNFDPDADFEWMSKRGWWVVRLDAAQCENVIEKLFPDRNLRRVSPARSAMRRLR
jgi:hypothetical protein